MYKLFDARTPPDALMYYGAEKLSDAELLAVLTGKDAQGRTEFLAAYGALCKEESGPAYMANCVPAELMRDFGMARAAACRIVAAVELGKRSASKPKSKKIHIESPYDAADIFIPRMRYLKKECFEVALLNVRNKITAVRRISEGNINSSLADPREVFGPAIKHGAASLILAHNHPSGDPEPSESDIVSTLRLVRAGEILGVNVIEHIVIGDGEYVSMRQQGLMGYGANNRREAA
jgi:DNA repair protein RadC